MHVLRSMYSIWFAALFIGITSSASIWDTVTCPPDKLSCQNGTDIGLVEFESASYTQLEHAKEGTYKDLLCYPKNFCSMRWLKDGLPFPWAGSSEMGVSQDKCNTTLVFRRVEPEAGGVYTCEVSGANGTMIARSIKLEVKAAPPPIPPIVVAGDLCANHTAELGSNATFRCEIYVGGDTSAYSYWSMQYDGEWDWPDYVGEALNNTVISETMSPRDGYIISELQIFNVSQETYTRYQLTVSTSNANSETNFTLSPPSSNLSSENGWAHAGRLRIE